MSDIVYVKNGIKYFQTYDIHTDGPAGYLFPVPEPNAVGTLCHVTNSITFLKFADSTRPFQRKIIAQNFSRRVSGHFDYQFSPNFSDDMVFYTKTRIVVICNVKTGEAFHAGFGASMDDYLLGIRVLEPENNLFVIVKSSDYADWWEDTLHLARLEGKRLVDLGKIMKIDETHRPSSDFPAWNNWIIHDRKVIAYDRYRYDTPKMVCFDGLKETTHPFAEVSNRNMDKVTDLMHMALHPELPFGVIVNYYTKGTPTHTLFLVRWDIEESDEQFTAIHQKLLHLLPLIDLTVEQFLSFAFTFPTFSPDGKWFVIGCFESNVFTEPLLIAIPVDKDHPGFLDIDNLLVLRRFNPISYMAWTTDPVALVVSGDGFYKWNFDELPNAKVVVFPDSGDGGGNNF